MRVNPLLLAVALLVPASAASAQTPAKASPVPPVSIGAIMRTKPKIADIRLEVELFQQAPTDPRTGQVTVNGEKYSGSSSASYPTYQGSGVSIGVPVLVRTSWCDTDFSQGAASARVDGLERPQDPAKCFARQPGTAEATLQFDAPFPRGACENLLARANYQVQTWELQIDERLAARATWPREWPKGMDRFLQPEAGINPADAAIKACAEGAVRGGPRSVTPYVAGKSAILAVLSRWKGASSTTSLYGQKGALRGINFTDSTQVIVTDATRGTPVELAATCVAALRSIGIPSRIVFCLTEKGRSDSRKDFRGSSVQFRFIGEFFVPDTGWIPFDPLVALQQKPLDPINNPVKGIADVPDLQSCLPLAYKLVPEGYQKADRWALWGWKGGVSVDTDRAVTRIGFDSTGRGNGKIPTMPAPVSDEAP